MYLSVQYADLQQTAVGDSLIECVAGEEHMLQKHWKKYLLFLILSIALELIVFNCRALFSLTATEQHLELFRDGNGFYAFGMEGALNYLYVGIDHATEEGVPLPVSFAIFIQDEGYSDFYELSQVTLYPPVEKSKYLRIHSYGDVQGLRIVPDADSSAAAWVTDVIYDAKVPWFISVPRILAIFVLICLGWCLRPGSGLYVWEWKVWQKRLAVSMLILCNVAFFLILVRSNPALLNPVWPYHQQYHQLAVSLSQGRVSIDAGSEEILSALRELENPYDHNLRMQTVPNAGNVWDTCYYKGNFYVYFGIVPVLLFYLPYFLIFKSAFPTWLGVFLAGSGAIGGVYYLLAKIRRRWFPESPYAWYLILSVVMSNGLNLFCAMLHADFYYLPIVTALCLSLWGLGLILSAADSWEQGKGRVALKLAAGSLCLALTAGCRPQFLAGSFLILPILLPLLLKDLRLRERRRSLYGRVAAVALPYLTTAMGLMYYNFIRFGSVLDFGANYNLTTNDMTRRGFELGRLPDGIFMYLFQPSSPKLSFPFAEVTAFYSDYLGKTVKEWTFGGAFWTHAILLSLLGIVLVKKNLQQKKLFGFTALCIGMSLVVVMADTEMAGILNRYYTDFLWLLMLPAVIVLFQMLERWRTTEMYRWILIFILMVGAWEIFYELGIAIRGSGIMNDNAHRYYLVKSFFQ